MLSSQLFGLGAIPLPSMVDRWAANTGRSEGINGKRPCHSRALFVDPSCSSFRCAQPIYRADRSLMRSMTPAPEASAPAAVVQHKQADGCRSPGGSANESLVCDL